MLADDEALGLGQRRGSSDDGESASGDGLRARTRACRVRTCWLLPGRPVSVYRVSTREQWTSPPAGGRLTGGRGVDVDQWRWSGALIAERPSRRAV
jgi:hypothetical protein